MVGLALDTFVLNSLLPMYVKCGEKDVDCCFLGYYD